MNFSRLLYGPLGELIKGSVGSLFIKVISAGLGFVFNILIGQYLGAEQAGFFFLAQAIILFLANLSRQGFDNAIVRFVAGYCISKNPQNISNLFFFVFFRVLSLSLCISILLYFFSPVISTYIFSKDKFSETLKYSALLILPMALTYLISFFFQGKKAVMTAMSYQSGWLVALSVTFFFIFKPSDAVTAIFLYAVCAFITFLLSLFQWSKNIEFTKYRLSSSEKNSFTHISKNLFLIVVMSELTQWSGQFLLGSFSSPVDVALFATSVRTAMLTSFILVAVNSIAAPKFAEAFKSNQIDMLHNISIQSGRLMTIAATPILLFMWFFAPYIMGLFGLQFVEAATALRILAIGQFINVITGSVGYLLQMTGNEKLLRNNLFIAMCILITLLVILVPIYGVNGAAIATAVAISSQNLLCVYQVKKTLGFNTLALWKW